jgi:hypothetical protein
MHSQFSLTLICPVTARHHSPISMGPGRCHQQSGHHELSPTCPPTSPDHGLCNSLFLHSKHNPSPIPVGFPLPPKACWRTPSPCSTHSPLACPLPCVDRTIGERNLIAPWGLLVQLMELTTCCSCCASAHAPRSAWILLAFGIVFSK